MILGLRSEEEKAQIIDSTAYKELQEVETYLLALGGRELVYMPLIIPVFYLRLHGHTFENYPVKIITGKPTYCHDNVIAKWKKNKKRYTMVTGYGLSNDGLWRQHSWLIDTKNTILLETTVARILYYGVLLEGTIAELFAEE